MPQVPEPRAELDERLDDLRARRHELLQEAARAQYWQRLVRARLDLAVAAAAHPDLPCSSHPSLVGLPATVLGSPEWTWDLLLQLHSAQQALAEHRDGVQALADAATEQLVDAYAERYATDPASCLPR